MAKLAFIGLGVMGFPMAGHLHRAGHEVVVYNRTPDKAERWLASFNGAMASTPRLAADGAEVVFSCVGNDDDLRSVTLGDDGALRGMSAGTVYVDHTTTSDSVAREVSEVAAQQGIAFVDAPVSGGQAGAENGALTVMCGGTEPAFEKIAGIVDAYAKNCVLIGPCGSGQLAKMVNQICIAGLLQALAEGLNFGDRAGLDMTKVLDVISGGAAQSWQMENRAATMLADEFDFGFAVDWMIKDLGIVQQAANAVGAPVPVTEIVASYYDELQTAGANRLDTSSLIRRLRNLST